MTRRHSVEDRSKKQPAFEPGYCIYDVLKKKPYIWRSWSTEQQARRELTELLVPYAARSEWRMRLTVAQYTGDAVRVSTGQPPRLAKRHFLMC